jgi:hypothetical protein
MLSVMWIASLVALAFATPPADKCVCLPGQDCWPSTADWNTFNGTVGGRLVQVVPVGAPCHDPNYDAEVCQVLETLTTNSTWRSDNIGMLSGNF